MSLTLKYVFVIINGLDINLFKSRVISFTMLEITQQPIESDIEICLINEGEILSDICTKIKAQS